jgi:hypothetical protein
MSHMKVRKSSSPLLFRTLLTANAFALAVFVIPQAAFASTEVFDPINSNTTWTQSGSPYILQDFIEVEAGITLTIEAGVVVKSEEGAELSVAGTLSANGTEAEPIYFTSIKDDEVGGDTNGDGNATSPSNGDWVHIGFTPGAQGSLTHTTIRYGGFVQGTGGPGDPDPFTGIYNDGATISLTHVSIINNGEEGLVQIHSGNTTAQHLTVSDHYAHGIYVDSGTMTIDQSTILNNGTGVYAESFSDTPAITITDSEIAGNTNGIIAFGASLSVTRSSIHGNALTGLRNSGSGLIDAVNNW